MISIREVARLAGVSPATVSRVMNGTAHVSESKKERVLAVIQKPVNENIESFNSRGGNLDSDLKDHGFCSGPIYCNTCGLLLNRNELLPNGDVLLCCMDYSLEVVLGSKTSSRMPSVSHQ